MEITKKKLEKLVGQKLTFAEKENGLILATTYDNPNLREEIEGKAKKPYEHFQVFDKNDQPIIVEGSDLMLYRKECHGPERMQFQDADPRNNPYHRGGNAFIVNEKDEILVIKDGRVVERGRHHELIQLNGLYHRMWCLQLQGKLT